MTSQQFSEREAELFQAFNLGAKSSQEDKAEELARSFRERYADDPELLESFEDGQKSAHSERVYVGQITNYGQAKYEHNPMESMSYFVTLTSPAGETTVWGKDLQRALAVRNLKVGDPIRLDYKGREAVQVQVRQRDANGKVVGSELIATHRNTWKAQKWLGAMPTSPTEMATQGAGGRARQPLSGEGAFQSSGQPRMSAAQSFMLGAKGLGGLRSMLSSGGGAVNQAIGGFRADRPELEFRRALEEAEQLIGTLVAAGVCATNTAMNPEQIVTRNHDILQMKEHQQTFDKLSSALDRAVLLSGSLIEKRADAGVKDSTIVARGLDPLKSFLNQHECVLKALPIDDCNLYDRLHKGLERLLEMIASLFDRVGNVNGVAAGNGERYGPKLGA